MSSVEQRVVWGERFVRAAVEAGFEEWYARDIFEGSVDDWDYSEEPEDALTQLLRCIDGDDGDC